MTEAGKKWVEQVNKNRPAGGEVGIVHPIDGLALLRAFCEEVENRALHLISEHRIFKNNEPAHAMNQAFTDLKRELLGE